MKRIASLLVALTIALTGLAGCGGGVKEQKFEVKPVPALQEVKVILQNYANGQPMTSEAADFPRLVGEVRKADPAKADLLEKGFEEMKKSPATLRTKAKELLGKL